MVNNIYFYTITADGKEYRGFSLYYRWKDVLAYFGVKREQIKRGCRPGLPRYIPKEHKSNG